jgi:hypothetical protein
VITFLGEMTVEEIDNFHTKIGGISQAIVVFDSPGGAVLAGIQIGTEIRARQFWTFVKGGTRCASACALAWLGGVRRAISPAGAVGFHAAYDARTGLESGWGNALIGAYLARLGLPDAAVLYITSTGPTSLQWLRAEDAVKVGIEAWELDWNRKTIVRLGSANEPKDGRRELPDSKFTTALPETALHGDRYAAVAVCFSRGLFGSRPCEPWSAGSGTGLSRMEAENQAMDECHRHVSAPLRNPHERLGDGDHECHVVRYVKNTCLALAAGGGFAAIPWSVSQSAEPSRAERNAVSECQQYPLNDCKVIYSICVAPN